MRSLLIFAGLLAAPIAHAAELPMQTALAPETLDDCVMADGGLRLPEPLPTQEAGSAICVEAEDFRSVRWQNEQGAVVEAEEAGGDGAIAYATEAIYRISVHKSGYYFYWQRAWIPRKASWSHTVQIDDRIPMQMRFGTREQDEPETWFWIAGTRHYLKRGVHTVAVRNLHNGKRLDRWVLTPDEEWTPQGVGPEPTPVRTITEGQFISEPIEPMSLLRWQRLRAEVDGNASVEVAIGDGQFRPLPEDGTLSGDEAPLRVRASLQRAEDGTSPSLEFGAVEYLADDADFVILRGDAVQLLLDRRTGRICGLRDARTGRRYLPDGTPSTLFTLDVKPFDAPEITTLSSDDAEVRDVREDGSSASLRYALEDGGLGVTVQFALTDPWLVQATLSIDNRSERDVIAVRFPELARARAGADGTDDVLCFPSKTGRLIERPGRAGEITNRHPIGSSIGFCDLHDDEGGLVLAPIDFPMVLTNFTSSADPGGQSTTLSLIRNDRVAAGEEGSFTAAFGLHSGDWHAAADWYRGWFDETVGRPIVPAWVHDSDGWVTRAEPEDMAGLGFDHIQLWKNTGYAGCPTYYYPNPSYRSEEEYTQLADEWRALGGHIGVYHHGNGMSRSYVLADSIYGIPVEEIPEYKRPPSWQWFVRNHGYGPEREPIEKLDMSEIEEPARHEEHPTMCWQAGNWTDYLEKWGVDIYLGEYGLDTPYWDTLGCRDRQEFNPFYDLNGEGRGGMARHRFMREMQHKGEGISPGFYQIVECGSELLGLVGGQLQSNFLQNLEVARYTHPDQIYYVGHSNGWWNPPKTHLSAARAFYLNAKFDLIRLTPNVMEVVRCRRWFAPWLYHARFMDTVGLELTSPQIEGALHHFEGGDRRALIGTFMNWQRVQGAEATIDVARYFGEQAADGVVGYAVSQGSDPARMDAEVEDGAVSFDLPAATVSAALFVTEPERFEPVAQARQVAEGLHLRIFDPAAHERVWRVAIDTEEAQFEPDAEDGALVVQAPQPSEAAARPVMTGAVFDYTNFAALTDRLHADVALTDGDVRLTTRALIMPRLPHPDFEEDRFDDSEAHAGQRSLRVRPDGLTHFPLQLIPGHRYRISLWIKRAGSEGKVYANVYNGLQKSHHGFGSVGTVGEWTRVETVYEMPSGVGQPSLYLYNWQGAVEPAWFDTVEVQDLGPIEKTAG